MTMILKRARNFVKISLAYRKRHGLWWSLSFAWHCTFCPRCERDRQFLRRWL
jgi:hypothetical protein